MFKKTINFIISELFKINDTPQKIALGVGLGVFTGLLPGTGPIAALFLAFIFKANRAAALLGSLLTNTWLSLVFFALAIQAGNVILSFSGQKAQWPKVLLPAIIGYLIIGLILSILSYIITLLIIRRNFHGSKTTHP